jgi:dTMP kinase
MTMTSKKKIARGRLIVLDGPDGVGKTTQAQALVEALKKKKIKVHALREPGGTAAGDAIRALVVEQKQIHLDPLAETFLFEAARAQLVRETIEPALARGEWVVCDRFTLSTLVYQGYAGGVKKKAVKDLSHIASGGVEPDLYFVLWVPAELAAGRRADRGTADRIEGKGEEYLARVFKAFAREVKRHPNRYVLVDTRGAVPDVAKQIWKRVAKFLQS